MYRGGTGIWGYRGKVRAVCPLCTGGHWHLGVQGQGESRVPIMYRGGTDIWGYRGKVRAVCPLCTGGTGIWGYRGKVRAVCPLCTGGTDIWGYRGKNSSDMPETITSRDAARFPIIASCTLFGLYIFFKIFSQEYINLLLSMYFFILGVLALAHTISPAMNRLLPENFPSRQYQLLFTQGSGESKEEILNYEFDTRDLVCLVISGVVGVWYLLKKHWIANNLFGLAFALNGVELLHLNNVSTGCILLGGLFVYDIFWVFGTNVMVTVAKSFEAPIKLVFPQDLLEKGLEANNFAMLGLGDIVIPGIFIALLLRFDISLKKNSHTYFYTSFVAYVFGLALTIFVMHTFKHAQPALLYLVPACIGFPLLVALVKGEVTEMFSYESSAELLPHTPRLSHFPVVSGSPASLAESMQQKPCSPRRRRQLNPSSM
uniref:Histocompatibility minor 13 n=1 Tax=Xenopus tropicalis TaxID=8364 RepID=A0A803JKQ3_XENTR